MSEPERDFTLLDDGRPVAVSAGVREDGVRLSPRAVEALGWRLEPEGLCREGLCVPLPAGASRAAPDGISLDHLAALLDRPLALELQERAAYLGASAADRAGALASLEAPDFALPDLHGRLHSLSAQRGKKVLLVAYASW
ncbi:MAG: hypothetical protein A2X52_05390 [Candidatus Rokubacteria bacterium GWC2_70_16]|nr:MAG: hypothetical protein A2X52_05390 [Candidatus Rokubacteria bacterium GWC2_70_16]OGL18843.1 MAG: hypothetical protein A3K12_05590 [Candidatus Rokubacteria bacterium RIFCSPLOWO2_12_FULL_71_19]